MAQGIVVDPAALEELNRKFVSEAETIRHVTATIAGQLENTRWEGHTADSFRSAWAETYRPGLDALEHALQDAAADVRNALQRALASDGQG